MPVEWQAGNGWLHVTPCNGFGIVECHFATMQKPGLCEMEKYGLDIVSLTVFLQGNIGILTIFYLVNMKIARFCVSRVPFNDSNTKIFWWTSTREVLAAEVKAHTWKFGKTLERYFGKLLGTAGDHAQGLLSEHLEEPLNLVGILFSRQCQKSLDLFKSTPHCLVAWCYGNAPLQKWCLKLCMQTLQPIGWGGHVRKQRAPARPIKVHLCHITPDSCLKEAQVDAQSLSGDTASHSLLLENSMRTARMTIGAENVLAM